MTDEPKNEDTQEPEANEAADAAPAPEAAAAAEPAAPAAAASGDDKDARMWATFCHLAALLGLLGPFSAGFGSILGIVGPLVVWLIKKDEYDLVNDQGKEALNFQITVLIAVIVSALLRLILIGFFLLFVVAIADIIFVIIAAIKANQGERYRYPVCIRFIK